MSQLSPHAYHPNVEAMLRNRKVLLLLLSQRPMSTTALVAASQLSGAVVRKTLRGLGLDKVSQSYLGRSKTGAVKVWRATHAGIEYLSTLDGCPAVPAMRKPPKVENADYTSLINGMFKPSRKSMNAGVALS